MNGRTVQDGERLDDVERTWKNVIEREMKEQMRLV